MKNLCNAVQALKPTLLMVAVQVAFAGVNIFYKLAVNDGMSLRVVVAYRFLFAAAFMTPLALIVERYPLSFFYILLSPFSYISLLIHIPFFYNFLSLDGEYFVLLNPFSACLYTVHYYYYYYYGLLKCLIFISGWKNLKQ